MTPAQHIADLDTALAENGEDIILRHVVSSSVNVDVTCRALVRAVSNELLIAGVKQDNSDVIISPTEIIDNGWPGTTSTTIDTRVPTINDKVVIAGHTRQISLAKPIYVAGELVRIDIRVLG